MDGVKSRHGADEMRSVGDQLVFPGEIKKKDRQTHQTFPTVCSSQSLLFDPTLWLILSFTVTRARVRVDDLFTKMLHSVVVPS